MNICIFEDDGYKNLFPLTYFRPVFELRCGASLLWEKFRRKFPEGQFSFITRDYLLPTLKYHLPDMEMNPSLNFDEDTLLINGRWLYLGEEIELSETVRIKDGEVVSAFLKKETIAKIQTDTLDNFLSRIKSELPVHQQNVKMIQYPWNLVQFNGEAIVSDFTRLFDPGISGNFSPKAEIIGDKNFVSVCAGAEIQPFVVLDTTHAPVIIDEDAIIYPFSRIEGPAYIGKNTFIVGGKIREGTTLGPVCRVGGEVEETIIQGYTNKWHDGFLGHGYVCEWVNIGAMATNSDLKNNYSNIKVQVNGVAVDTNDWKAGAFIGDHCKLGIGTLLNTGSVLGPCTNIFGSTGLMPPKYVPSFCWGSGNDFTEYHLDAAISTAKIVLSKRDVVQNEIDINLMKKIYEITTEERNKFLNE
jgi:UDP-N-acetylglucosamine diphosphorylase/glucosamine-1-phosphate N-acetyltransferase